MCGVAGIFSLTGKPIKDAQDRITCMTRLLDHRGPDHWGVTVTGDELLALGNTRLAIVDPEARPDLPLASVDGCTILSFNGEIYDYLDVRRDLEDAGVVFRTRTDTEVLLEGLRRKGYDILERLDGVWAFAYYDCDARRLLLSRDLMGERHLFYRIANGELIFASEMIPILIDYGLSLQLDFEAVVTALCFNAAPQGGTLVEGIKRLWPGHNLVAEVGAAVREYRYRKLHPEKWLDFFCAKPSLDSVLDTFEDLLNRAVTRRLPRDVRFFSTLSGGLDSAIISMAASDYGQRRIRTMFALSTDTSPQHHSEELSEYASSQITAKKYNTDHTVVRVNNEAVVPVLSRLVGDGFDGCLVGSEFFEMLGKKTREENTKVILLSDGPDELVGGYEVDRRAYEVDRMHQQQRARFEMFKAISTFRFGRRVLQWLDHARLIIPPKISYEPFNFIPNHQNHNPDLLANILPEHIIAIAMGNYGTIDSAYGDLVREMDYTQLRALSYATQSLPDMSNLRADKGFMRASVEVRMPFQAPEMVDFLVALTAPFRFGNGNTSKWLLRKIVERRVGPEVSTRSKHGASAPLWKIPAVNETLRIEETLGATRLLDDMPFKSGTREFLLRPDNAKTRWAVFTIANTYERLQNGIYS